MPTSTAENSRTRAKCLDSLARCNPMAELLTRKPALVSLFGSPGFNYRPPPEALSVRSPEAYDILSTLLHKP